LANECVSWIATGKVIRINCLPVANAGADQTICNGSCATIGVGGKSEIGVSYSWAGPSGPTFPNGTKQISVCPTTTTTYTLTSTNSSTECTATDAVTVTVVNNHSTFNYSDDLTPLTYYTVSVQMTPLYYSETSIAGWGDTWIIQELNPTTLAVISSTDLGTNPNPTCWWTYGAALNFPGYATSANVTCPSPTAPGQFLYGHRYKIIHTTWNSYCSYVQSTYDSYHATRMLAAPATNDVSSEGVEVASAHAIAESNAANLDVYPNPGTGLFNIELNTTDKTVMEVYDMLGNKIKGAEIVGHYQLDLTGYAKGIYMIKMTVNGQQVNKKIILE